MEAKQHSPIGDEDDFDLLECCLIVKYGMLLEKHGGSFAASKFAHWGNCRCCQRPQLDGRRLR
eukprot:642780-Amphidinium_carterae.1